MTEDLPDRTHLDRIRELGRKRREVLALAPEDALERILSDPQPAALVHSFPETDLYLLIHDIGPEDALPILALASERQWDHVVDLEGWQRDRVENGRLTRWLNLLLEADPDRFFRWALTQRLSFVEFYLFHNVEVRVREHDQDPSEFGEDFFTLDNVYYVRFLKLPPTADGSALSEEERRQFLTRFLERLAAHDHLVYQSVLLEAAHVIPAEAEEEEYRWRTVRLAEKGFPPTEEAIGIYQPVTLRAFARRAPKSLPRSRVDAPPPPVPEALLRELPAQAPFSRALAALDPEEALAHIQWEFTNLCNQIVVADGKTIRSRDQLREIVTKACGYLNIGLERLKSPGERAPDPRRAAQALTRHPLVELFRLGFGGALELKWQAETWLRASLVRRLPGCGSPSGGSGGWGCWAGSCSRKPLCYDNYTSGVLYREFHFRGGRRPHADGRPAPGSRPSTASSRSCPSGSSRRPSTAS
jgi:hypothetical protein